MNTQHVNMYNEKNIEWLWMVKWKVGYFGEGDKVGHNFINRQHNLKCSANYVISKYSGPVKTSSNIKYYLQKFRSRAKLKVYDDIEISYYYYLSARHCIKIWLIYKESQTFEPLFAPNANSMDWRQRKSLAHLCLTCVERTLQLSELRYIRTPCVCVRSNPKVRVLAEINITNRLIINYVVQMNRNY